MRISNSIPRHVLTRNNIREQIANIKPENRTNNRICKICGGNYKIEHNNELIRKYCSNACKKKGMADRVKEYQEREKLYFSSHSDPTK